MKTLLLTPVAIALSVATVSPAIAESEQDQIIVSSSTAMENWRGDISRDLGRNLELAERWAKYNPEPGIVQVRFQLDADGRPTDMVTYRSSGSVSTDRAAMWAVRRLNDLDQAPAASSKGATFQANIIFAETTVQKEKLSEKLAWIERKRLASAAGEANIVSLGS